MPTSRPRPRIDPEQVRRLWLHRQGLLRPHRRRLTARALVKHLETTGGLQLDSVNVVDRAHYLTLWSRFGSYDRKRLDRWIYRDRVGYEYWGHEASILPASRLPLSRRAMRRFRPSSPWWQEHRPSPAAFRRVRRRIRDEGPLESADFQCRSNGAGWWSWKEDKRALEWLWFRGDLAISARRHFRRVYDLAERIYPDGPVASLTEYEDGWLHTGLSGNGIASEKHLRAYFTSPRLKAGDRRRVIARNLRRRRIVEVEVPGLPGPLLARPHDLENLHRLPAPEGTTLLSPFDSLLWQRERAEDLLGFRYRVEIYVSAPKRTYGYYVLPILHRGSLVGRLDPKLHRERGELEIRSVHTEPGFDADTGFRQGLAGALTDLATFLDATRIILPRGWRNLPV